MRLHTLSAVMVVSSGALAQAPRGADVWVVPMKQSGTMVTFGEPRNVTQRAGYDNQPAFTSAGDAVLYTVIGSDAQADTWKFSLPDGRPVRVTHTKESEYSPTPTPDGRTFSVIRVEADSAQRLWRFPFDGQGAPSLVLEKIKPVGYHAWVGDHTLVIFVLGRPNTLQVADDRTGTSVVVARNVGRALVKVPARDAVTFLQQVTDSASWITDLDVRTKTVRRLVTPPPGADYHVWTPNGALLAASGSRIYIRVDDRWDVAADFGRWGVRNVSRLAVSPRGDWFAFVADDGPAP